MNYFPLTGKNLFASWPTRWGKMPYNLHLESYNQELARHKPELRTLTDGSSFIFPEPLTGLHSRFPVRGGVPLWIIPLYISGDH